MPFVTVKVAGPVAAEEAVRLQRGVTALMADILGKKAELTAVLVEHAEPNTWTVGAEPVAIAAHLDATITAGTNDADDERCGREGALRRSRARNAPGRAGVRPPARDLCGGHRGGGRLLATAG